MPILSWWIGVGIVGVGGGVDEWVSLREVAESREELCEELVVAGLKLGQDVVGHGEKFLVESWGAKRGEGRKEARKEGAMGGLKWRKRKEPPMMSQGY